MLWLLSIALFVIAALAACAVIFAKNAALDDANRLRKAALFSVGPDEVQRLAEKYISEWNVYKNHLTEINAGHGFAPITTYFLNTYYEIISQNGACRAGLKYLAESEYRQGMITIGSEDYLEICVFHGSDVVYVIDGSEGEEREDLDDNYPSIFHFLLDYADILARP